MREKMIAIAGRLRARAAEFNTGIITKDILNCIATEIEKELEAKQLPEPPLPKYVISDKETTE